jgi:hypothetical protein
MPNFNANFRKIAKENLMQEHRTPLRLTRIRAAMQPFIDIYLEFKAVVTDYTYKCKINGSVIYLETALNDLFDNTLRRIFITNNVYTSVVIYKASEALPPIIGYRRWQLGLSFATGKFCFYQGNIYEANATALDKVPGVDVEWTARPDLSAPIIHKKIEYTGSVGFYVNVPAALVYDQPAMRALINYYRMAGTKYSIVTF